MYAYLYDPVLRQRTFRGFLDRLETRLTDFGLGGKIYRLGPLLHLNEIVLEETRRKAKTIVAIGTDRLFHQLLNAPNIQNFVVGFVPVNPHSIIGTLLGVPPQEAAATVLAHRITRSLHLASANAVRFFWELSIPFSGPTTLKCDDCYAVTPNGSSGRITVRNTPSIEAQFVTTLHIKQSLWHQSQSVFHNQKISFEGLKQEILIDGQPLGVERLKIEHVPTVLRVIVGRNRHEALDDVDVVGNRGAGAFAMA